MRGLTVEELDTLSDQLDRDVIRTAAIDRYCSSSAWILPAARALMPPRQSWIRRGEHGWLAAMCGRHASGISYVEPLELAWGMACPLISPEPEAFAGEVAAAIAERRDWNVMLMAGMTPGSAQLAALIAALPARIERRFGQSTLRIVASLEGGLDGFLSRRSRNFRKALRASSRDAAAAGITFERIHPDAASAAALYDRIVAIERKSWKGEEGVGIQQGAMHDFYADMLPRLAARGRARVILARQGDRDVAFCLGAVFDGEYRGLQFSYDLALQHLSLGSLCQQAQIEELAEEGVRRYDLGQDMDYKRRWAEDVFETTMLILVNR